MTQQRRCTSCWRELPDIDVSAEFASCGAEACEHEIAEMRQLERERLVVSSAAVDEL